MPSIATIVRTSTDGGPWPPPNPPDANEEERLARLEREREAQKVSDAIDRAISIEKEQRKKQNGVKLLLLGTSPLRFSWSTLFLTVRTYMQVKQNLESLLS